jgi:hypothetical protein
MVTGPTFLSAGIQTPGTNAIDAPLEYGRLPAGASEHFPAQPIAAGKRYVILLGRMTGLGTGEVIAFTTFTAR